MVILCILTIFSNVLLDWGNILHDQDGLVRVIEDILLFRDLEK